MTLTAHSCRHSRLDDNALRRAAAAAQLARLVDEPMIKACLGDLSIPSGPPAARVMAIASRMLYLQPMAQAVLEAAQGGSRFLCGFAFGRVGRAG
jgi:hypothetical protein